MRGSRLHKALAGVTACVLGLGLVACVADGGVREAKAAPTPAPRYTLEQAISDRAQGMTIAFDGLGFLTGTLGSDSFFPPGKVADFWGFQYLRDNDPSEMGHNTDFLTRAALNMYTVLSTEQRAKLKVLATSQVAEINDYGYKRFVLMKAFRRLLEGDIPAGATGLDESAVKAYSASLYALDGHISYERARVMGGILSELTPAQKATLDAMVGRGMTSWPDVAEPDDMRGLSRDEKVAVMTYAGDLFSWYAGDLEADVYFCPERHGTYFGSFYLKDAPAVGNPGYSIPTTMTGDMGERFVAALTPEQAALVTGLVSAQKQDLLAMVDDRRAVSTQLRLFRDGSVADTDTVMGLMDSYGAHDGAIVYKYATAFAAVGKSLTDAQKAQFEAMRTEMLGSFEPTGAFLYSQAIPMPTIPDTDFLFGTGASQVTTTTLSLKTSASSVKAGAKVTLTAHVDPSEAATGRTLYLDRKSGSKWVQVGKRVLTGDTATFISTSKAHGTFTYRVRIAANAAYTSATSSTVRIRRR